MQALDGESMTEPGEAELRAELVDVMQRMETTGLNRGTTGNASVRSGDSVLMTPTSIPADELTPESIVSLDAKGHARDPGQVPSSEWQMHVGIYARRPDVRAVVHCHSRHASILACCGRPIPSLHYMVGVSGRSKVPLAAYACFGSAELAESVIEALDGGFACLMANHGQIALGSSLGRAFAVALEIEEQSAIYWGSLAIGGPTLLTEVQMAEVFAKFRSRKYGGSIS
jgi:L-fuculose-phosphate aldolase